MEILMIKVPIYALLMFAMYLLIWNVIPDIKYELKSLIRSEISWYKPLEDESKMKIKQLRSKLKERIANNG